MHCTDLFVWIGRLGSVGTVPAAIEVYVDSDVYYLYRTAAMYKKVSVYTNSLNAVSVCLDVCLVPCALCSIV